MEYSSVVTLSPTQISATWDVSTTGTRKRLGQEFCILKVTQVLESLSWRKTTGPNRIWNEHLKAAIGLAPFWTAFFYKYLRLVPFSLHWLDVPLLFVPKADRRHGAGSRRSVSYKPLSYLLTRRLNGYECGTQKIIRISETAFDRNDMGGLSFWYQMTLKQRSEVNPHSIIWTSKLPLTLYQDT